MPTWAARHLAEAAMSPEGPPPAPGRHRYGRRRRPEPSRLRGWALATAAVAAAVGTVPLAVANLARQEEPLPQVETFPVVAPVDTGDGENAPRSRGTAAGSVGLAEPGPDLAGTLPPLSDPGSGADVVSPRVAPTAAARPWRAAPPQAEQARIPRPRPPQSPQRPPSAAATPTTDPAPGDTEEPRDDPGGVTSPRESTPTTTPTTTPRHRAPEPDPDSEAPAPAPRSGLLGSTLHGVTGLLN